MYHMGLSWVSYNVVLFKELIVFGITYTKIELLQILNKLKITWKLFVQSPNSTKQDHWYNFSFVLNTKDVFEAYELTPVYMYTYVWRYLWHCALPKKAWWSVQFCRPYYWLNYCCCFLNKSACCELESTVNNFFQTKLQCIYFIHTSP